MVSIPLPEFRELLEQAAEVGGTRALEKWSAKMGLDDEHAAKDIAEMRGTWAAWRSVMETMRKSAVDTVTRGVLKAFMFVVVAGVAAAFYFKK
jgi:hypothetical protein